MILDVIGIIFIVLFFIRGYAQGFIVAVFSVLAILLGVVCALKLSQAFAAWMLEHHYISSGWAQVISYIILFIVVILIVNMIGRIIQKALEGIMLGTLNQILGGLLYGFLGAVLWSSFLWIGARMHMISPGTIAASHTYPSLSGLAPWFCEQVGKLLPFAKDTFEKLEHFFDTINQQKADHVGAH